MRPASSATCSCAATATRWWWSWPSAPRSRASRSRATRTSRPRICRSRCATSGSPTGKTFDRSVLEDVTQYLTDQYFSRGKYARAHRYQGGGGGRQPRQDQDRHQGRQARQDPPDQHRRQHALQTQGDPRHSRAEDAQLALLVQAGRPLFARVAAGRPGEGAQLLHGPRLRQLPASSRRRWRSRPEKEDIFITVNVDEGEVYKISAIKLAGTFVVPKAELERLVLVQPGQIFNRKLITSTQELIQNRLGARRLRLCQGRSGADRRQHQRTPWR